MPRPMLSKFTKAKVTAFAYLKEFSVTGCGELMFKPCKVVVSTVKAFNHESHRKSSKNQSLLPSNTNQQSIIKFKLVKNQSLAYQVADASLQANIL